MADASHSAAEMISKTMVPDSIGAPASGGQPTQRNPNVEVMMAPPSAAEDVDLATRLHDIVNLVYGETEGDIFIEGYQRVSREEMQQIIRAGELAVAYLPAPPPPKASSALPNHGSAKLDRRAIGCIRIRRLPGTDLPTGELGLLAIDPSCRGGGMGRDMVAFAESHCRSDLGLTVMRLELLVPVGFEHSFKKRLQDWYARMGYKLIKLGVFQEDYPHIALMLTKACEYRIFEKELV